MMGVGYYVILASSFEEAGEICGGRYVEDRGVKYIRLSSEVFTEPAPDGFGKIYKNKALTVHLHPGFKQVDFHIEERPLLRKIYE